MIISLGKAKMALASYAELFYVMNDLVTHSSDEELAALTAAPKLLSQTSCSWADHRIAPLVAQLAQEEVAVRTDRNQAAVDAH